MSTKKLTCKVCQYEYDYSKYYTGTGVANVMIGCLRCFEKKRCEECGKVDGKVLNCKSCRRFYCGKDCFGVIKPCFYCNQYHCKNCEEEMRACQFSCAFCKKISCNECSDVGRFFDEQWACEICTEKILVQSFAQKIVFQQERKIY
jgi:hypothetical protein